MTITIYEHVDGGHGFVAPGQGRIYYRGNYRFANGQLSVVDELDLEEIAEAIDYLDDADYAVLEQTVAEYQAKQAEREAEDAAKYAWLTDSKEHGEMIFKGRTFRRNWDGLFLLYRKKGGFKTWMHPVSAEDAVAVIKGKKVHLYRTNSQHSFLQDA